MIKTQDIDRSNCANVYGARTNAAINATKLGTSIKISEDGDIDIYRNVIFRDGTCILENVLTIKQKNYIINTYKINKIIKFKILRKQSMFYEKISY